MRVSVLALVGILAVAPAAAQVPDTFTNLKVLPDDITREQLLPIMRGFTEALGIRCSTCHVGEEGQPLSEYDFASDDKEMKRTARTMLRMVRAINGEYLTEIGTDVQVECFTCHHGARHPQRLEDVLVAAWRGGGPDSLVRAYQGYRDQYYGRAVFDFGPRTLIATGQQLAQLPDGVPAAVRTLQLQTSTFPDEGLGWVVLGQALAASGDTAGAITAVERGETLLGPSRFTTGLLRRLRGGGGT